MLLLLKSNFNVFIVCIKHTKKFTDQHLNIDLTNMQMILFINIVLSYNQLTILKFSLCGKFYYKKTITCLKQLP